MPLRPSITNTITRLKRELGVCADSFEDEALQDALDIRRTSVWKKELCAAVEEGTGLVDYTIHYADGNDWEMISLFDQAKNPIISDQLALDEGSVGMWHFNAPYTTVYLSGHRHDLNGTAADLWERRASDLAHQIDTTSGDLRLSLSQAHKHAQERAAHYRSRTRPRNNKLTRSDISAVGTLSTTGVYPRKGGRNRW